MRFNNDMSDQLLVVLYQKHYDDIVRLTYLLVGDQGLAEEISQDAFVTLKTTQKPPKPGKEAPWLRSVALNKARTKLRRRSVGRVLEKSVEHFRRPNDCAVDDSTERSVAMQQLRKLPRRQKEVLVLRYYLDLSERETGEILKISTGSVKTHARRGLDALRSLLEHNDE